MTRGQVTKLLFDDGDYFVALTDQSAIRIGLKGVNCYDAAPAMLAVLKKLRRGDLHQRVRHLYDEAQAAIKAAETGVKP